MRTIVLMIENITAAEMAVGRSSIRRRILALLMADPEQRLHLREIQRRARTSPGTASRELARLVAAGLVERRAEGNQVYFRPASSPFAKMVRSLFAVPLEPADLVEPAATAPTDAAQAPMPPGPMATAPQATRPPRTIHAAVSPRKEPARPDATGLRIGARLAEVLRPLYADRLVGAFMYGARARGESKPDADVEIVVVLDEIHRYGDELERTSSTCAALSLEFGLVVSRVFVSESTWKSRTDGHLLAIRAEAVAL
jgi:predicted nucleotidyltransferase